MKPILAWHFTDGRKLRDGQNLVTGRTYRHTGDLVMCESGLHASVRLIAALRYAPGSMLSRVACSGEIQHDTDKLVCSERKVLWVLDAERVLHRFAIWCAYGALLAEREAGREPDPRSWNALAVKTRWISGDATTAELTVARAAAWDAAWDASWDAARAAAWDAARAAAWTLARDAAWDAARAAAWTLARAAAWDAAEAAQNAKLVRMVAAARRKAEGA